MAKPRFLLDEHVNQAIQRQLWRLDVSIEVLAVGDSDAPGIGTTDPNILVWIEENGYILVTENRRTIPAHLSDHYSKGRHIPGLFWLRPSVGLGEIIEELYLIWLTSTADEFEDRTLYLPL